MLKSDKESANLFAKKARFFLVFIVSIFVSVLCKIDTFATVEMGSKTAKQPITVNFELQEKDSQEPVDPTPTDPTPIDPTPVDPTPVEPEPTKPEPVDPTPTDPTPVEPKPVEPEPTKPEPTDPNIPETGNTGLFTINTSSNFDNKTINILASVTMALAIVFCVSVLLINKKREKSAREYLLKSKQVKKSFLFLPILLFATSISIFATNFLRAKAENADYPFSIALSSPSSVAFFAKQGETVSKTISTTIESDNPTGYSLGLSADSLYLENESGDRISFSQSINNSDSTITLTINGEDTENLTPGNYTLTGEVSATTNSIDDLYDYYNLSFNSNDPIGESKILSSSRQLVNNASPYQFQLSTQIIPEVPHYAFLGWNTEADGTGSQYVPTDSVSSSSDEFVLGESGEKELVLYAQWQENDKYTYNLWFNANGGDDTTIPSSQKFEATYDTAHTFTIPSTEPERTGHTFAGWSTTQNGSVEYSPEDDIELTSTNPQITLYAVWTVNQYTITFNTDGGSEVSPITQDYGTAIVAPADPTKANYSFQGWDKEIPSTMPAENMTITAEWLEIIKSAKAILSDDGMLNFVYDDKEYGEGTESNPYIADYSYQIENTAPVQTPTITAVYSVPLDRGTPAWTGGSKWCTDHTCSDYREDITSVNFDSSFYAVKPVSTAKWFYLNGYLSAITNTQNFNTENVTDMSYMFYYAGLGSTSFSPDLSSWDTSSVTDMSSMFYYAGLGSTSFSLDLSSWNTSSVTDMSSMFFYAGQNSESFSLDLSSWDTSSVTDMSYMFAYAGQKSESFALDFSSWDTSSVTNMLAMFECVGQNSTTWTVGDLSSWDTSSVANMSYMFACAGQNSESFSLDLTSWNTSSVTDMNSMFYEAGQDSESFSLDLSSWDTSNVTDMHAMFDGAGKNSESFSLDLSSWDTSSVTYMNYMFNGAGKNSESFSLDLSSWDTSSVTNMSHMFYATSRLTNIYFDEDTDWNAGKVTDSSNMFYGASSLPNYNSSITGIRAAHTGEKDGIMGYFTKKSYSIIFNGNGATVNAIKQSINSDDLSESSHTFDLTEELDTDFIPTNGDRAFLGWDEDKNATEPTYKYDSDTGAYVFSDNSPATITLNSFGEKTLYAVWEPEETEKSAKAILSNDGMLNFVYDDTDWESGDDYSYTIDGITTIDSTIETIFDIDEDSGAGDWIGYWTEDCWGGDCWECCDCGYYEEQCDDDGCWDEWIEGDSGHYEEECDDDGCWDEWIEGCGHYEEQCDDDECWDEWVDDEEECYEECEEETCEEYMDHDYSIRSVNFDDSFSEFKPKDISRWFFGMYLEGITNIENFNTSEATTTASMFEYLNYESGTDVVLDLSGMDFGKVTDMSYMFFSAGENSTSFSLDLSSWDTSSVTDMSYMFQSSGVKTVYVGNGWTTANVTSSDRMFNSGYSNNGGNLPITGGAGTTWTSSNPTDKTYARIDRPDLGQPGYFTDVCELHGTCATTSPAPTQTSTPAYNYNYTPSTETPVAEEEETPVSTSSEKKSAKKSETEQEQTNPLGVEKSVEQSSTVDTATIAVIVASFVLVSAGAVIIYLIERKRIEDGEY